MNKYFLAPQKHYTGGFVFLGVSFNLYEISDKYKGPDKMSYDEIMDVCKFYVTHEAVLEFRMGVS